MRYENKTKGAADPVIWNLQRLCCIRCIHNTAILFFCQDVLYETHTISKTYTLSRILYFSLQI